MKPAFSATANTASLRDLPERAHPPPPQGSRPHSLPLWPLSGRDQTSPTFPRMAPVTSVPREEVGGPRQGDLAGPLVLTLCPLLLCRMWQSAGHTFTQSPLKAESPRFVCVVSWPFKGKLLPQPPDFGGFHTLGFAGCGGTWVFLSQVGRSSLPSFGGSSPPPLPQL